MTIKLFVLSQKAANVAMNQTSLAIIHKNKHPNYTFWLFVLASVLIFIGLGLRDPWPADEPRFAQVAKEMVETGQWFFPARAGEFYPDKPVEIKNNQESTKKKNS